MAFQAKDSQVLSRQLEAQSLIAACDLVNETSDAPALISIDSSTIAATEVVIDVKESVEKCFKAQVIDRQTGEASALTSVDIDGSEITLVLDATGLDDVAVEVCYKVSE